MEVSGDENGVAEEKKGCQANGNPPEENQPGLWEEEGEVFLEKVSRIVHKRLSLSLSVPDYDKDDLIQEICLAAIEWEKEKRKPFPPSLLKKFASRRISDFLKKYGERKRREVPLPGWKLDLLSQREKGGVDIEEIAEELCEEETKKEEKEELEQAILKANLTKGEKRALNAYLKEGQSIKRAARRLRMPLGTMRSFLCRSWKKMRCKPEDTE